MITKVGKIHILGTSHIASESLKEIEQAFYKINPAIVAVELDRQRLFSLLNNEKPNYSPRVIREIGFKGYLFVLIGGFLQQKLGNLVNVKPGSDMLKAVELARQNSRKVALIDRDVKITLSRLSKKLSFKEKARFFFDLLVSPFSKKIKIDLKKVPEKELITRLILILKDRYPTFYKVLIEERNQHMASRLLAISEANPEADILAVVGAGHEVGIKEELLQEK
jgi:pheromone shutdown-related protein TraB